MKSYIKKIGPEAILYLVFVLILSLLPWHSPQLLEWKSNQGTLNITLEKSNGESISRTIDLSRITSPIKIFGQKIEAVSSSQEIHVSPAGYPSDRIRIYVGILVTAAFFLGGFVYFRMLVRRSRRSGNAYKDVAFYFLNLIFFGAILNAYSPGFLNFDSLFYYQTASSYQFSDFIGFYFNSFMVGLFQLFPYPWILPVLNVILISAFLTHLFIISRELKSTKFFFLACFLFYLYPANDFMVITASRDILSHWVMFMFLVELYLMFSFKQTSQPKLTGMAFSAALLSVLRPETVYVLLPYLVFLTWKDSRIHLKWAGLTILLCLSLILLEEATYLLTKRQDIWKAHYKTTLLVNPLSYVLKKKYTEELPPEVSQELGTFFKNDYLVKYQDNHDIPAFHKGGINPSATIQEYTQFRNASIGIFLTNPLLYLENRFKISTAMFGLSNKTSFVSNEYPLPSQERKKIQLGFNDYSQSQLANKIFNTFNLYRPMITKSYVIPFLVLFISFFYSARGGWYRKILYFLIARTLLVIAITPGGYFKYNYSLWLFPIFMLPMLVWEYKSKNPRCKHGP